MESTSMDLRKTVGKDAGQEENTMQIEVVVSRRCRRKLDYRKAPILDIARSTMMANFRELSLQNIYSLRNSIPKHITSLEDKYIIRCLELIHNCALRAAARNFTSKVDNLPDMSNLTAINNLSSNSVTDVILNPTDGWTVGTISNSQSVINILNSRLLQQFNSNSRRRDSLDASAPTYSDFTEKYSSPLDVNVLDHKYGYDVPLHKIDDSISLSSNSSSSNESFSPAYGASFEGMLHCTWKDGLPHHHIFTVDEQQEVYTAKLLKVESLDGKGFDYVYTFHSRRHEMKACDTNEAELEDVARMQMSTSITFSPNNLKIRETQFILSVSSDDHRGKARTSNNTLTKNSRLAKKVVNVFKSSHSAKQRSLSIFGGANVIFNYTPSDSFKDAHEFVEDRYAPNFELAAIVVKDIFNNHKVAEPGGWGLKFLKTPRTSAHSRDTEECTTSVDVVIPAGFHGGPKTGVGGPSSLKERWISGGRCDCGGWDTGCPLTILNTRPSSLEHSFSNFRKCKSVEFFKQGSKQNVPIMKMVNTHKGLYYISSQSPMSTLQSFAVALAIIHSQTVSQLT